MTYALSENAEADLEVIRNYSTERHGPDASDEYLRELLAGFAKIAERPDLGNGIGRHGLRSRILTQGDGHVAIYRIREDDVEIVRVFHTRQNWAPRARRLR